jgi:protein SCO1/2
MKRTLTFLLVAAAIVGVFWTLGNRFDPFESRKPDPYSALIGRTIPDFSLTAQSGQPLQRGDLSGKVWVAALMFATCKDVCLQISGNLKKLDAAFQSIPNARIASISVNPEQDTPESLAEYGRGLGASGQWFFLTGTRPEIRKLAQEGFFLSAGTDEAPLYHSEKLVVIDGQGAIRGYFDGLDPASVRKITRLVTQLQNQPLPSIPQH